MKNLFAWFCFNCNLCFEFRDGVHESVIHWFGEGFELGLLWICCTLGHSKPVSFMWVRCLKMRPKYWEVSFLNPLAPGSDIQIHVSWRTRLVLRAPVSCFSWAFLGLFVRQQWPRQMTCVSVGAGSPSQEYKVRKAAIKIILNVVRF